MSLRRSCMIAIAPALALGAMLLADPPASQPDATHQVTDADRTALRALIQRLGRDRDDDSVMDARRALVSPEAIAVSPSTRVRPLRDRDAARADALDARSMTRAYDGAPPVMPHSRHFAADKTCLDCHAEGMWLGKRFGPPLSHPHLTNCTQCHVESLNREVPTFDDEPLLNHGFEGLHAPLGGAVAMPGGPPVMPHATFMRSRCLSCHGPNARDGLKTTHPHRMNCTQCHAPAASLDQTSPFFTGEQSMLRFMDEPADSDEQERDGDD